jgi:UTP:GlnB (protein PII) uridylyltransferase
MPALYTSEHLSLALTETLPSFSLEILPLALCLVTTYDETIARFMKDHGAERGGIFGSYARGEAHPDSDLDLLVWFTEQQSLLKVIRL